MPRFQPVQNFLKGAATPFLFAGLCALVGAIIAVVSVGYDIHQIFRAARIGAGASLVIVIVAAELFVPAVFGFSGSYKNRLCRIVGFALMWLLILFFILPSELYDGLFE